MIIRIQNYDNKAPVAEISLLNLSNWTLWSVTPPHLSLSLSPPSVFLPANHYPSFLTLSTRCPPLPSFCHLRFLFALMLTSFSSFHLPVMLSVWLALTSEEFFFSCSVALGSFSVSLFHSHILLLFPLISCLCQNRWFLSSGSSSLVFPPFHPFFFLFCPTFSFLLCCHHLFRSCLSLTHITVPRVFLCFSSHISPLCDAQSIIPVPYCTISWQLVDAYIF